ncbi:hypothetical protein R1sor_020741 [Riccia sorocarpa]|uniref:Uncharacterized protein n=1 Tax=Riccia sorocarpa TaxID=122646 RepID=A0ABD3GID7_9MARC
MEEDDEIALECSSNWKVVEGCLEGSVVVAKDSDGRGVSGAGGRVVLVPTSEEYEPCELTVSFRGNLSYVRQLYVLSSARTLEFYSQGDEDNGAEYVSTVRGTLVSLSELETFTEAAEAEDDQRIFSSASRADEENEEACLPENAENVDSEAQNHTTHDAESGELMRGEGEQHVTSGESLCGRSGGSDGGSFHVVHSSLPVEVTLAAVTLDQPLDPTDWVECTHSPTKSSASSDDEADVNKCGFLLVDSDGENLVGKQDANDDGRDAVSENERESTGYQISKEQSQLETTPEGEDATELGVETESYPEFRTLSEVEIREEDNEVKRDELGASGVSFTGVQVGTIPVRDSEAEAALSQVYEAEVDLNSSDAWKSVKIRLLSLKDKSKLELHKVVINAAPGPAASSLSKAAAPFGQPRAGFGSSSFLSMLAPGILQMARGLADSRRTSSLGLISAGKKLESDVSPSLDSTMASLSVLQSRTTTLEPTGSSDTSSSSSGRTTNDSAPLEENNETSLKKEAHLTGLHSSVGEPWMTGIGSGKNSNAGESSFESHQSASQGTENSESHRGVHQDLSIVQRLDRLEAICLRMENFMTVALNDIDGRLKKMEVGIRGVIPESGEPWGSGSEPATFVSASSVNVAPARRGEKSDSPSEKHAYTGNSAPADSHAGRALPEEGVGSTANPDRCGFVSSASPSLLSSVSPALPLRFSSPKRVSAEANSRVPLTSTDSKNPDQSMVLGQSEEESEKEAEATYWAVQTFDDTGSDVSSEHSSSSGNEDFDPCSCPESVSSSPSKSAQRVENVFRSVSSAASVPFDATELPKHKNSFLEEEEEDEEDSDEDGSFTSAKQAPLVDIDCITLGVGQEAPQARTEEMLSHGSTIPVLSSEKEIYGSEGGLINKDVFWASEAKEPERGNHMDWQDSLFGGMDRSAGKTLEKNPPVFDITEDLLLDSSAHTAPPFVANFATYDLFPERSSREEHTADVEGGKLSMEFEQADVLVQEVPSGGGGEGEGDILDYDDSWHEELNYEMLQFQDNVAVADTTVKDIFSPVDPPEETLLKEEVSPEEWNWFTSEVVRSASNKENLHWDPSVHGGRGGLLEVETDVREVRSLLDEDVVLQRRSNQLRVDVYSNGWDGPRTLSSLLDDDPPIASGRDFFSDEDYPGYGAQELEPKSLLDEDMFNPPKEIITVIEEEFLNSPQYISSEEPHDLSGVMRMSKFSDTEQSPSSGAPNSNSFNDDYTENVKLEHENLPARDLLEDFEEESHELDRPDSEYTQSLLFHLSL